MKFHILLKLRDAAAAVEAPAWTEVIEEKRQAPTRVNPSVDALLERYGLPVFVTREYKPQRERWSPAEIESGLDRVYRLVMQRDREIPRELIQEICLLPVVEYARVGRFGHTDLPPLRAAAMSTLTDRYSRKAVHLDEARERSRGDESVTVAVLDTGVCASHPEFADVMLPGYDFVDIIDGAQQFIGDYLGYDNLPDDEVGHGTHVAGIIAAKGRGCPEGVVPRCKLLPVRVLAAMERQGKRVGAGLIDNINTAVKWAVDQGADVINMSLGIRHSGGGLPHEEVVDYARRRGVTIVAAAGNDGQEQLYYPGALPYVIAVGAFDESGEVADYSTYGAQVSFVAPGTNVYSTYLENDYAFSTGTSLAAPFVAGGVALLKSYARSLGRKLSDAQVKHVLKHTADKVDANFKNRKAGFGKLNLADALRLLEYKLN